MEKALIFSPPSRRPNIKKQIITEEPPDIVVLAPFTKTPRLVLNNIILGCTTSISLIIENPANCDLQVWINPPKFDLELSWETHIIKAYSREELSITWTPTKVFSGCSVIKIQAENGMKKDISLILKSIAPVSKKKSNSTLKSCVKKPLVCSQQNSKIRKVLHAAQKSICTEITTLTKPSLSFNTSLKKNQQKNCENKENENGNTKHFNFCDILDSSEFSLSRMSPVTKTNISSTPITDSSRHSIEKFCDKVDELTPLKDFKIVVSKTDIVESKVNKDREMFLEKINNLCFTPVHSSTVNKINTQQEGNNTYTVNYNNAFVKDLHSGRVSSPINDLSMEGIPKDTTDCVTKNATYQLNLSTVSSGTYKICTSPEIHDDIIAIDEFLIHKKKKSVDHSRKDNTQKSSKIKITYTKSSLHTFDENFDLSKNKTVDPFILSTMFYDEQYFEQQELHILKWLNALLKPPADLLCPDEEKINLGKLWNDVKNKPLNLPQTKEVISHKIHVNHRLQSLRCAARKLFREPNLVLVLSKCTKLVESEILCIRSDRQLHLDVALQKYVMQLFLCYNPLWLRIGLETVCNEPIDIISNSDIHGLSVFIYNRLFRGQNVSGKQNNIYKQEFAQKLKKFVLKKFLMLVLFLDRAKKNKLIAHDPCLFAKSAHIKESREMLFNFAKELIAGIGDITRPLKTIGYVVTHKQSYLDEFDFAVKNLAVDIRDGIRLAKIMEIILLRKDLVCNLRAPAISRLQKIFNVTVSFTALQEMGFSIQGEITPRDITDGYKEKTLSFFWQIIYKFQAPLFVRAATSIQAWWRSEPIYSKRKQLQRQRIMYEISATFIQCVWRGYKARINYKILRFKSNRSAKIIQRTWKIYKQRLADEFHRQNKAATKIQKAFRSYIFLKHLRTYVKSCTSNIIFLQRYVRSFMQMKEVRSYYMKLKKCTVFIQRLYRAKLAMRVDMERYQLTKKYVVFMQRFYRNKICMRLVRNNFLLLKSSAKILQTRFRANKAMQLAKAEYQAMKTSAVVIQRRYRANKVMEETRNSYLKLRWATIIVQERFRAQIAMKHDRIIYTKLRETIIFVQRKFRACKAMLLAQNQYLAIKKSTIIIQKHYRAQKAMQVARSNYIALRNAIIILQTRFRANLVMKKCLNDYQSMKKSAIIIQKRYRALRIMQKIRNEYLILQKAVILVQNRFRAQRAMKIARNNYLNLQNAALVLQTRYKANVAAKKELSYYTQLRKSAIVIQRKYKAIRAMRLQRENYLRLQKATELVQTKFRAKLARRKAQNYYQNLKYYVILIQRKFRTRCILKRAMAEYKLLRISTIVIQTRFRAYRTMLKERKTYKLLIKNAILIQRKYRAKKAMQVCRNDYIQKRNLIIRIQEIWRATLLMKTIRSQYVSLKYSVLFIQRKFRAQNLMKIVRQDYILLRQNVINIQIRFRAQIAMKICFVRYNSLKKYALFVQRQFRANCIGRKIKEDYNTLRNAVISIQRKYKANQTAKNCRERYLLLKKNAIIIQRLWRAQLAMKKEYNRYQIIRATTIRIQRNFRSTHVLINNNDPTKRRVIKVSIIIKIQAWWRAVQVRKKLAPRLAVVFNRLNKPVKNTKQISIKEKTNKAIETILVTTRCDDMSILETIAFSTRIYPQLYINYSTQIARSLYITIINNNRSVPELKIAFRCSEILVNLVKFRNTLHSVLWAEQIPELITSASRFCDKEELLFCNILTLLWIFGQHSDTKLPVKRALQKSDCKKTLHLIAKKVTRLDVMQNNLRKNKKVKTQMLLPLMDPDYGITRKNPRSFTNPKFGLQCLLQTFNIPIEV